MVVLIFYVKPEMRNEAKKILEADPYAKDSFAIAGYKFKEAKILGLNEDGHYIYLNSQDENFLNTAKERLKEVAELLEGDKAKEVTQKFDDEENAAAAGIGNIFG